MYYTSLQYRQGCFLYSFESIHTPARVVNQFLDGSCSSMKYFKKNIGREMDTMMRNHARADIQVERMIRRLKLIENTYDKKYSKKKGRKN